MSDTCGPTSVTPSPPFARWSSSGRTWTDTGLLGLTLSLGTLPRWGCLHGGELYELPTPALLTSGHGSSSLPTPTASDANGTGPHGSDGLDLRTTINLMPTPRAAEAEHSGRVATNHGGQVGLAEAANALLPTPHAGLGERGRDGVYPNPRGQQDLQHTIATDVLLLPTPTVVDMGSNKTPTEWTEWTESMRSRHGNGNGHGASLTQEALAMLPTPTAQDSASSRNATAARSPGSSHHSGTTLDALVSSIGESTAPPSTDGSESSDDQHRLRLF